MSWDCPECGHRNDDYLIRCVCGIEIDSEVFVNSENGLIAEEKPDDTSLFGYVPPQIKNLQKVDNKRNRKICDYVSKNLSKLSEVGTFWISPNIPEKKLRKCKKSFGFMSKEEKPLILFDHTIFPSGKRGILFTDRGFFFKDTLDKPGNFSYKKIKQVHLNPPIQPLEPVVIINKCYGIFWGGDFLVIHPFIGEILKIANPEISYQVGLTDDIRIHNQQIHNPEFKKPLGKLARGLLGENSAVYDESVQRILMLSRSGDSNGVSRLQDAIEHMYQREVICYYEPGLVRYDSFYDDSVERILQMARENALWKTPLYEVQQLLTRAQSFGSELRSIWLKAKEVGCHKDQVRAIQLLGLHLACQVSLRRAKLSNPDSEKRINAPKGVYCVLCKSRYSIEECIDPSVSEGRIILFTCPKCNVPRAYDPFSDKGL